jgi:hypothetical protein
MRRAVAALVVTVVAVVLAVSFKTHGPHHLAAATPAPTAATPTARPQSALDRAHSH